MGILDSYRDRNANSDGFLVDFDRLKEKELIKRAMACHTRQYEIFSFFDH